MTIRPIRDRIIVQRLAEESVSRGGIYIPDDAREKPTLALVVAAGPGRRADDGTIIPMSVQAGDVVVFGKFTGVEIAHEGEDYVVMREDDVLAVEASDRDHIDGDLAFMQPTNLQVDLPEGWEDVTYAKDQPQYNPLPAARSTDAKRRVVSRWTISKAARARIAAGEDVFLEMVTYGALLQPVRLSVGPAVIAPVQHEDAESTVPDEAELKA